MSHGFLAAMQLKIVKSFKNHKIFDFRFNAKVSLGVVEGWSKKIPTKETLTSFSSEFVGILLFFADFWLDRGPGPLASCPWFCDFVVMWFCFFLTYENHVIELNQWLSVFVNPNGIHGKTRLFSRFLATFGIGVCDRHFLLIKRSVFGPEIRSWVDRTSICIV